MEIKAIKKSLEMSTVIGAKGPVTALSRLNIPGKYYSRYPLLFL
jgi:hypothetical protein